MNSIFYLIGSLVRARTTWGCVLKVIAIPFSILIMPFGVFPLALLAIHGWRLGLERKGDRFAAEHGFSIDHRLQGQTCQMLVDKQNRKMLFISRTEHEIRSFDDVTSVEYAPEPGQRKGIYYYDFIVHVRDENNPRRVIDRLSEIEARDWHAKMLLILGVA